MNSKAYFLAKKFFGQRHPMKNFLEKIGLLKQYFNEYKKFFSGKKKKRNRLIDAVNNVIIRP